MFQPQAGLAKSPRTGAGIGCAMLVRCSAATAQHACSALTHLGVHYARSGFRSFIRDYRTLFRVRARPTGALELGSSADGANEKLVAHRSGLAAGGQLVTAARHLRKDLQQLFPGTFRPSQVVVPLPFPS